MRNNIFAGIIMLLVLISCGGEKQTDPKVISYKKNTETSTASNNGGTNFYEIPLDKALEMAIEENKFVFVACSTTDCGPCRMMRRTVFTKKAVGEFMNSYFIPVHMNLDEGTGQEISKKYSVGIYPTYLILNQDGSKRGEVIGAEKNIAKFLENIKQAAKL